MQFCVVIPTLNEQRYIGKLLDSLLSQTLLPDEIVVVDAESCDATASEVKKRQNILPQLRLYQIPKHTISRQRNWGVAKTRSPHLLFLDADAQLCDSYVLEKYIKEVGKLQPDLAIAPIFPLSSDWRDKVYFAGANLLYRAAKPIWPMASGVNLYFKREVFERVGKFDEGIVIGEDFELVQRAVKARYRFLILTEPKIHTSPRRLHKEGRVKFTLKLVRSLYHVLSRGFRKNPIAEEYQFGNFQKDR